MDISVIIFSVLARKEAERRHSGHAIPAYVEIGSFGA